jgi:hypothetical protein
MVNASSCSLLFDDAGEKKDSGDREEKGQQAGDECLSRLSRDR